MVQSLDYWRLCTDFTIVQAALIICGLPPDGLQSEVEGRADSLCPPGYVAVRTALKNAVVSGRIEPSDVRYEWDDNGHRTEYINISETVISGAEIDRFLKNSGMISEFFDRSQSPGGIVGGEYNNLPLKLAAALKAWSAVTSEPNRMRGKSPKQALEVWLLENASELGLLNRDGQPNRTGIEEICKVANWKPEGGATPTPSGIPSIAPPTLIRLPGPTETFADLNDEIPF